MLHSLSVRDVVLIDRLDLVFGPGLVALTGETGAGKSILLDALGLVLGGKGERGLVREGVDRASVTAVFEPPEDHPVHGLLATHGLDTQGDLVLRRIVSADGRGRAFVNDQTIGMTLLRQIGELLVELHGQHDQRGLLNPATHRAMLDAYGDLNDAAMATRTTWRAWRDAAGALAEAENLLVRARRDEEYLRHRLLELEDLAVEAGEEEQLAELRVRLQNRDKLVRAVGEALDAVTGSGGAAERLGSAQRQLERLAASAGGLLDEAIGALDRALVEAREAEAALDGAGGDLQGSGDNLERTEERLFALRDAARKHRVPVDELPRLLDETARALAAIDAGDATMRAAASAEAEARSSFVAAVLKLRKGRDRAAVQLAEAVMGELPPLHLERARFNVCVTHLDEDDYSAEGGERVSFEVATNVGQRPGSLSRIASGGELSRFMLALKVVLARLGSVTTLIFDEIDAGIGGATADAVGERLALLGHDRQVLVVTHAPQIAARAGSHLRVAKTDRGGRAVVQAATIAETERREEIARMLAGAEITDAARAAADSLIAQAT